MTTLICAARFTWRSNRILACTREPGHAGKHSAAGVVWNQEKRKA